MFCEVVESCICYDFLRGLASMLFFTFTGSQHALYKNSVTIAAGTDMEHRKPCNLTRKLNSKADKITLNWHKAKPECFFELGDVSCQQQIMVFHIAWGTCCMCWKCECTIPDFTHFFLLSSAIDVHPADSRMRAILFSCSAWWAGQSNFLSCGKA